MNELHAIDILTLLVLLWAVINGWRRGVILQLCSLAGIVVSLYVASVYGREAGAVLHLGESWAAPGGFLIVAVATLLVVTLLGRLCRKVFHFAGLGTLDILLGILVSLVKWLLLLSALYSAFAALNRAANFVDEKSLEGSRSFAPICRISDFVLPFVSEAIDNPDWKQWLPDSDKTKNA